MQFNDVSVHFVENIQIKLIVTYLLLIDMV